MKRKILKSINILFLLFSGYFLAAQPEMVEGIVAVVGDQIILKSDIDEQYETYSRQPGAEGISKCRVFEDLLFEKLLIHQAEIDSVIVTDEEVDGSINQRVNMLINQIGSQQKLEDYYQKSVVEIKEEMRPLMKNQMTAQRMQGVISGDLKVTPTEIAEFYNSVSPDSLPLVNTQVELAQIVKYPVVKQEAEDAAVEQLLTIKGKIENGSSFSTMAILYSEDPGSAKNGGEYKAIKRGVFVKEFEAVAFNLQPGQISDPFKTEFGFHIVQVIQKRGEELDLRHILIKPKITTQDLREAELFLDSLGMMINRGDITFEEAANKYSDDDLTKYNGGLLVNLQSQAAETKWEINMLDRSMFLAIDKLEVGQLSRPTFVRDVQGKESYVLVKLVSKVGPHKANLKDDYGKIKSFALGQKRATAIADWIEEKSADTYIKINGEWANCEFTYPWLNKSMKDE